MNQSCRNITSTKIPFTPHETVLLLYIQYDNLSVKTQRFGGLSSRNLKDVVVECTHSPEWLLLSFVTELHSVLTSCCRDSSMFQWWNIWRAPEWWCSWFGSWHDLTSIPFHFISIAPNHNLHFPKALYIILTDDHLAQMNRFLPTLSHDWWYHLIINFEQ